MSTGDAEIVGGPSTTWEYNGSIQYWSHWNGRIQMLIREEFVCSQANNRGLQMLLAEFDAYRNSPVNSHAKVQLQVELEPDSGGFKRELDELKLFGFTLPWSCSYCTFFNEAYPSICEMCSHPNAEYALARQQRDNASEERNALYGAQLQEQWLLGLKLETPLLCGTLDKVEREAARTLSSVIEDCERARSQAGCASTFQKNMRGISEDGETRDTRDVGGQRQRERRGREVKPVQEAEETEVCLLSWFSLGDFGHPSGERDEECTLASTMNVYALSAGQPSFILGLGDNFYATASTSDGVESIYDPKWTHYFKGVNASLPHADLDPYPNSTQTQY